MQVWRLNSRINIDIFGNRVELSIKQKLFATVKDGIIIGVSTSFTLDDGLSGLD